MKDRQVSGPGAKPGIPVLSPVLHWICMPVIVFLRSGFGYSFLSPKSVFIACAWASGLFCIYAWLGDGAWRRNWAVSLYAGGASAAYLIQLGLAFARENKGTGSHDHHSGRSHILRLAGIDQEIEGRKTEILVQLWLEPLMILLLGAALRGFVGESRLSYWLLIVAASLWLKEFLNYWYGVRAEKKQGDILEDAEAKMPGRGAFGNVSIPKAGGRKARVARPPNSHEPSISEETANRHAQVLRLMPPTPPFDPDQIERHYKQLIKLTHPDANKKAEAGTPSAAELNEAVEFFRGRSN